MRYPSQQILHDPRLWQIARDCSNNGLSDAAIDTVYIRIIADLSRTTHSLLHNLHLDV